MASEAAAAGVQGETSLLAAVGRRAKRALTMTALSSKLLHDYL